MFNETAYKNINIGTYNEIPYDKIKENAKFVVECVGIFIGFLVAALPNIKFEEFKETSYNMYWFILLLIFIALLSLLICFTYGLGLYFIEKSRYGVKIPPIVVENTSRLLHVFFLIGIIPVVFTLVILIFKSFNLLLLFVLCYIIIFVCIEIYNIKIFKSKMK
jgi:hypothetical protein